MLVELSKAGVEVALTELRLEEMVRFVGSWGMTGVVDANLRNYPRQLSYQPLLALRYVRCSCCRGAILDLSCS